MIDKLICYFLIFFIYSVIGYFCEVTSIYIDKKDLTFSRGFLIGPYIPIFGFGGLIITMILHKYMEEPITLFLLGMVYCCILEYVTSYFLERIFHLRWWDYSDKKHNVNGRICLENGILFGIGALVVNYITNPAIFKLLRITPVKLRITIGIVLLTIMTIDTIISTFTIVRLEIDTTKYINIDSTKEIKEKVYESLKKYRSLHNRILKAFPNITKQNIGISQIKDIIKYSKERKGLK